MDGKAIELRREYQRQWRQKNKQRVKEYNRQHWERRAARESRKGIENEYVSTRLEDNA